MVQVDSEICILSAANSIQSVDIVGNTGMQIIYYIKRKKNLSPISSFYLFKWH